MGSAKEPKLILESSKSAGDTRLCFVYQPTASSHSPISFTYVLSRSIVKSHIIYGGFLNSPCEKSFQDLRYPIPSLTTYLCIRSSHLSLPYANRYSSSAQAFIISNSTSFEQIVILNTSIEALSSLSLQSAHARNSTPPSLTYIRFPTSFPTANHSSPSATAMKPSTRAKFLRRPCP